MANQGKSTHSLTVELCFLCCEEVGGGGGGGGGGGAGGILAIVTCHST